MVPNREIRKTAGKPPQRYGWMADSTVSADEAEYGTDHTEWAKAKEELGHLSLSFLCSVVCFVSLLCVAACLYVLFGFITSCSNSPF
jgi:hypothetical protein